METLPVHGVIVTLKKTFIFAPAAKIHSTASSEFFPFRKNQAILTNGSFFKITITPLHNLLKKVNNNFFTNFIALADNFPGFQNS